MYGLAKLYGRLSTASAPSKYTSSGPASGDALITRSSALLAGAVVLLLLQAAASGSASRTYLSKGLMEPPPAGTVRPAPSDRWTPGTRPG